MKLLKKTLAVIMVILTLFTTYTVAMPVFAENEGVSITEIKENNEPEIISEDINKRTETSKQFLMSDGSYVLAQYNSSVHYLTDENEWVDIDNTLCESAATTVQAEVFGQSNIIRTKSEETNIVFAEKANSNTLVFFDDEKYPISLNYQSMKNSVGKVAEKDGNLEGDEAYLNLSNLTDEIIYENVYDNVDLQYIVSSNGIKENIILKNASAQNSFVVNYNIGELSAKAVSKNEIHLLDGKDVIYVISAPVMYDAEGNTSSEIELKITKNKNGKLTFEILPDKKWLANATYPVTIDPYVSEVTDTSIEGVCVNGNSVSTTNFTISYGGAYALLNLVFFTGEPVLDHIVSAKLDLPVVSHTGSRVYARKITESWREDDAETSEYVIVNTNPTVAETVEDYFNITTDADKLSFDLTGLYSEWENGAENNGIKLEMATQGSVQFDITSSSPLLTVNYMSTCGLNATMPYTEYDMGSAGYVYVNNFSGNLIITRDNEISTTGEEYPYDFSMTYNSLAAYDEDNSHWLPSYMSGFSSLIVYTATDGTQELFVEGKDNTREDFYVLKENDYGWECLKETEYWTVTLPIVGGTMKIPVAFDACKNNCTEKYSYNTSGLQKITIGENLCSTPKNERVVLSREKIEGSSDFYLVDGSEQKLRVSNTDSRYQVTQYSKDADGNYEPGESVTYTFDDDGNVTQIKRGDAVEAAFTYVDDKIASITDNENHTVEFEYNGKRITKVTESRGDETGTTVSFERHSNTVTARTAGANGVYGDNDDALVTSRFSPDLKLLGESYATVSGESLGAVSYDRDDNAEIDTVTSGETLFDGIKRVGITGKTPDNLLKNHNIESVTDWTERVIADANAAYTAEISNEKSYVGAKSFKVAITDFTKGGAVGYVQTITPETGVLDAGEKYVASAYINASAFTKDEDTLSATSYGGFVMVEIKTPSGTNRYYSNPVVNTGEKWERAFLDFEVPENFTEITIGLVVRNGIGTAYFDAVQFEKGDYPGQYNMLENNSFNYVKSNGKAESWTSHNLTSSDVVTDGQMKIIGSPDVNRGVLQEVQLANASQSDTYTVSCWAQADSMPEKAEAISPYYRNYAVRVLVFYNDGSSTLKQVSSFNHYDADRQYTSSSFNLEHPEDSTLVPVKTRILLAYYLQCNTAFFDDVALFRSAEVYDFTQEVDDMELEEEDPYTYDDENNILTYTDEEGVVYTYTYNSYGDVVSILNPDGIGDTFEYEVYDTDKTRIKKETYEDGTVYEYTYHNADNIATETVTTVNEDEESTVEVYNYDEHGNLISYTVDNILKESYTYIVVGGEYLVATETADGYVTTYSYNSDGEVTQKVKTLNGVEVEKDVFEYSGNYLSKHSHTENGVTLTTHYNRDGAVTMVEHNGFAYKYKYDDFGNTKIVSVGMVDDIEGENDSPLITYSYLPDKSNLSGITYGNGDSESYTYTAYGQLLKKTVSSLGNVDYRYDNSGNLAYQKDELSDRRTYFSYDLNGNYIGQKVYVNSLSNTNNCFLFSSANAYDDEGRIIRRDMQGVHYALDTYYHYDDESGLISSAATTAEGTRSINYTYDDEERVVTKSMTTTTPYVNSYTYNDDGLIATDTVTAKNGTFVYNYTYDDNGNITEITKNGTVQQRYIYDETDQLVREDNRDINKTVVYTYDGYGNILTKSEYAFTTGDLGAVTDTISYTYDSVWKDKLTSYDEQSITYDEIGNPTSYRGATMTWNGRKLMSYAKDGKSISYKYDGDGLRTQKVINGVKHSYYYENGQLLYEIKEGTYELYYKYDADGNLFSVTRYRYSDGAKHVYYAVTNTRGDVTELRTSGGSVYATYTYDSWGRCVSVIDGNGEVCSSETLAVQNSIRYRGYVYDSETGLYYLQSRYYDPETGRFLNADDVDYIGASGTMLGYNAFAYCENNAVCRFDVSGMFWCIVSAKISSSYLASYMATNSSFYNTSYVYYAYSYKNNILKNYFMRRSNSNSPIKNRVVETIYVKTYDQWIAFLNFEFKWLTEQIKDTIVEKLNITNKTLNKIIDWLYDEAVEKGCEAIETRFKLKKGMIPKLRDIAEFVINFYYKYLSKRTKYFSKIICNVPEKYRSSNYMIVIPSSAQYSQYTIVERSYGRSAWAWVQTKNVFYK